MTIAALVELAALSKADWESALQQILRIDAGVLDVERVSYWSFREEPRGIFCELAFHVGPRRYERGAQLLEVDCRTYFDAIRRPEVLIVENAAEDPRLAGLEPYLRTHGIVSMMDVPIWVCSDLEGILCHEHVARRPFGHEDAEFALAVSQSLSAALEARRWSCAQAAALRSEFLGDVSARLSESLEQEEIARRAVELAIRHFCDWTVLDLLEGETLRRLAFGHRDPALRPLLAEAASKYPPGVEGAQLSSFVMRLGQSVLHPTVTNGQLARYATDAEHAEVIKRLGCRSVVAVPLLDRKRLLGVMSLVSATRLYDQNDLRMAEDFAERVAAAFKNARLYREAREAIVVRDEFLSLAAHELRTPLNGIQLSVDRLEQQLDQPLREATPFKVLVRQVSRLSRLAEQLLDASQLGRRALVIQPVPIDLAALVEDVAQEFHYRLESAGCTLELVSDGPVRGSWDPLRLTRVLSNLLDNAIKFAPERPIEIKLTTDGGNAVLVLRDHGQGIPPERLRDIFEPYKRGVPARHFGGLGLGLYVVRAIVEAHGGTASVESWPGEGTAFTLTLPIAVAADAAPAA